MVVDNDSARMLESVVKPVMLGSIVNFSRNTCIIWLCIFHVFLQHILHPVITLHPQATLVGCKASTESPPRAQLARHQHLQQKQQTPVPSLLCRFW